MMIRRILTVAILSLFCAGGFAQSSRAAVSYIDDQSWHDRLQQELEQINTNRPTATKPGVSRKSGVPRMPISLVAPGQRTRDWAEVFERAQASVVVIGELYKCKKCAEWHVTTASGFIVSTNGVLVTNAHVLENAERKVMGAMTRDGRFFPIAGPVAANRGDDVALTQLAGDGFQALPVLNDKPVGSAIGVVSHPDGAFYTLTTGIISRYCFEYRGPNGQQQNRRMMVTADYAKGSSGGPVLDTAGNVVGLASSTVSVYYHERRGQQEDLQQVMKYCVPAQCILELIQKVTP